MAPRARALNAPVYDSPVSSQPSSRSTDMPRASASSPSCATSGSVMPLSHLDMVWGWTFILSASSPWVTFADFLKFFNLSQNFGMVFPAAQAACEILRIKYDTFRQKHQPYAIICRRHAASAQNCAARRAFLRVGRRVEMMFTVSYKRNSSRCLRTTHPTEHSRGR